LIDVKTGTIRTKTEGGTSLQWSPDGKQIATIIVKNGLNNLYAIDVTSGQSRRLTPIDTISFQYSPDSKQIAFSGGRKNFYNLFVVDADGRNQVELTRRSRRDVNPSWSPDGKQIVFWSDLGIAFDIFSIDVATRTLHKLTNDDGTEQDQHPAWQPTPRLLTLNPVAELGRS
jgi:TolB protein